MDADDAVGRFCGDVLKPCNVDGKRLCDCRRAPSCTRGSKATRRRSSDLQIDERGVRTTVITSSGIADGLQVQVIRDETELEAVRRARDTVLANISHEFRTPLAAQLASIELLREGLNTMAPEQSRGAGAVAGARHAAAHPAHRQPAGKRAHRVGPARHPPPERRPRRGGRRCAARSSARCWSSAGRRWSLDFPEDLPPVGGDVQRLTQVYVNLITNASKFAPEGSTIRVGARR